MNPDNQPQQSPFIAPPIPPQYQPPPEPVPPPARKVPKLLVFAGLFVFALVVAGVTYLALADRDPVNAPVVKPEPTQSVDAGDEMATDKAGIQKAIDQYCVDLGKSVGFVGMDSGYIISDRFSEEELSDSPELLRFKQVGEAASATVDCEDSDGPNGISNDLLFVKDNQTWSYVDEVQNNAGTGFLCSVVDKYSVSKELVAICAPSEGQPTSPR